MKNLWNSLNPLGLLIGAVALALSLTPSLLPRPAVLQGFGSGLLLGIGYAIGVGISAALTRATPWRPPRSTRRVLRLIGWPTFAVVLVLGAIGGVAAQNEVRRMVELAPLDGVNILGFVVALLVTSILCLGVGRLLRLAHLRTFERLVEKGRPRGRARHAATARTTLAVVVVLAVAATGTYVGLDVLFRARNGSPDEDLSAPASTYRSSGAGSEVEFSQLGRNGGDFIAGGPSAEEITALTGRPARTPIRVYVGEAAGGSLEERAATAVRELERTGAFERQVLVVATTTGAGWVEAQAVDSVEYLHSGDTATVALQYAHTPSFVSALTDADLPVQAATALFQAVRAKWLTLPEDERPQLVVYGLSLGAQGTMNSFGTLEQLRAQTDGALLVGPTNSTPMWRELQTTRDPGSPPWMPVRDQGSEVRWATSAGDFTKLQGPWDEPRVAILQHATDPVTWLSADLLWRRPEWLSGGERAPDVSPSMHWIPVVTGVQVALDMLVAVDVPARHGHAFGDMMLDGWVAVTGDGGLEDAALDRIRAEIETYWDINPALE